MNIVVGNNYGQTINGTTFKYKVLVDKGLLFGKHYYQVQNIETGYIQTINEEQLHNLD